MQTAGNLGKQSLGGFLLMLVEAELSKPRDEVADRHADELGDGLATHLNVVCLFTQTGSMTVRTDGLATIACQEHTILYLILVLPHHLKEIVDAHTFVRVGVGVAGQSMPQPSAMLLAQFVVRGEDREIVYLGTTYEVAFPLAQFLAMPACHTTVIDAEGGVGDDEILVDANDAAVALACGTDAHGRVEREEVVGRFFEGHSVSLHERRERNVLVGFADKEEVALAVALIESRLGRVEQA